MNRNEIIKLIINKKNKENKRYYVYILLDQCKIPFYVGCGQNYRCLDHESWVRYYDFGNELKRKKIKDILLSNEEIIYEIDSFYENRKDSMIREKELIKEIGRIDLGADPLTNLTDGGFGGVNLSPPIRKQISISRRKWIKEHPEEHKQLMDRIINKTKSKEGRQKIKEGQLRWIENNPEKHKERQRKSSEWTKTEEGKELISKISKERNSSKEGKIKISNGVKNWIKENPEDYKLRQEKSTEWTKTPEGKEILRKNMEWTKTEEGKELLRNNRLEYIRNNPEKEKERLEKLRKTVSSDSQREKNRQRQKLHWKNKLEIINRCENLIREYNLEIKIPSKKSSFKTFLELENKIKELISLLD